MRLGRRATRVEARAREAGGRGRRASGRGERSRVRSTARLPGGDTRAIAGKGFARRWRDTAKDARERPGETRARASDGETRARTRARSRTPSPRSSPPNPSSVVPSSVRNFERRATGDAEREARKRRNHPEGRRLAARGRRARFEKPTIETRARRRVVPRAAHRPVALERGGHDDLSDRIDRRAARDFVLLARPNVTGKQS